jgi:hypothetical protein
MLDKFIRPSKPNDLSRGVRLVEMFKDSGTKTTTEYIVLKGNDKIVILEMFGE